MAVNDFGERVKQERTRLGWSQARLADEVGISRNYLSQIERGEASNLSWQVKNTLARKLGILLEEGVVSPNIHNNLPPGLGEFATDAELPPDDVAMLARLEYRGQKPKTAEQWKILYKIIKSVIVDE